MKELSELSVEEKAYYEDLEKAASNFVKSYVKGGTKQSWLKEGYIAGAKWQKEQMLENAIPAELYSDGMFTPLIRVKDKEKFDSIKFGDKVKIIIIKDE